MSSPRKLASVSLQDIVALHSGGLSRLYARVLELNRLNNALRSAVPEALREHLSVANFDDTSIVIVADSPVWATRLRFNTQQLLAAARTLPGCEKTDSIRIKTTTRAVINPKTQFGPILSPVAAAQIRKSAVAQTDLALQETLNRLASRCRKK